MKDIIKRVLTESTKLDKTLDVLLKLHPNLINNIEDGIELLKELGFDDKEISGVFRYYFKTKFLGKPDLDSYFEVFDSIFKPEGIDYDYEDDFDSDGDDVHIKFTNYTEDGLWRNDDPIMDLYRIGGKSTLEIDRYYTNTLNSLFGNKWKEPFKIWFKERFDEEVKRIG